MPAFSAADGPAILVLNVSHHPTPHLRSSLVEQGFRVWACESPLELRTALTFRHWALVLIDLPLPVGRGLERCALVRELFAGPVAVVSGQGTEADQLRALAAGADEFIGWPVSPDLLGARLRALLRRGEFAVRTRAGTEAPLLAGGLMIDPARREVRVEGRRIGLTNMEFNMLHLLARHTGSPVSRDDLFQELRGLPFDGRDRSMDLRISRLRRKLGDDGENPRLILTVRGIGYQLAARAL